MSTYQDVVAANNASAAWALVEAAGLSFAPYIGGSPLAGSGVFDYQQAGPFAASFGLRGHVGSKLTLTFAALVNPPVTLEAWFAVSNLASGSNQELFTTGNAAANGVQWFQQAAGHLEISLGGVTIVDTALVLPSTGYHLLQASNPGGQSPVSFAIDGVVRWQTFPGNANTPVPNVLTFLGDSSSSSTQLVTLAFPAFYPLALNATQLYASFLAKTDPAAALPLTVTQGASSGGSNRDLLNLIYAAVHRSFPTT